MDGNIKTISYVISTADFEYGYSAKPYALIRVESSTQVIPAAEQNVRYTSFEKADSIAESSYVARLYYNTDDERCRMVVTQNGSTILTRWYAGSNYMKETTGSVTKEFTWIGGDAYTAPVIAVTQSGTTTYYYLLRDYLGNITHQVNTSNTVVAEYNFDAWGRRRSADDWSYTMDASDLAPIADRGFTGHELLSYFNLYNMNGRMYDPLVGRFLNVDPYVQLPDYSQNLNRYSYCLNNPLIYTDPDGELFWLIPVGIGALIGGWTGHHIGAAHGAEGWDMAGYILGGALIGGASGGAALGISAAGGGAMLAGAAAGAVGGAGFSGLATGWNGDAMLKGAFVGAAAGFVGGGVASAISGGWGALAGGAASNVTGQLLSTGDVNWTQVGVSAALSFGMYHGMSYAGYKWGGGDNLGGKHISYRQYCGMNADYQRSRFWHKENGGYLMTDGSIKRVPYADEHYLGVKFKNPPSGAWASYHTHWANPGTTYQVTLPNYDKPTDLDLLLGNYSNGVASQYHDAQDLSITGNTYVINRFDGSFHPYGAASYNVIAPDPFIRFFMFNWWW